MHLWALALDGLFARVDEFRSLLAAEELQRADRFHFERDAYRYIVGRAALRRLLASYDGGDARDVAIAYGQHGKPAVSHRAGDPPPIQFNLAHTGGYALLAFTRTTEIGVDVERLHELSDLDSVMHSCFALSERTEISAMDSVDARHRAFFRCWTRKEAILKALGSGLARPLDSFEVSIDDDAPRLRSMAGDARAPDQWRIVHFEPAVGYIGAAAWVGSDMSIQRFAYEP